MNTIDAIRSKNATLFFLVVALTAQIPHAAGLFHMLSLAGDTEVWYLSLDWYHAIAYAFALEVAILHFVLNGRKRIAWGFACVSILVNLGYYYDSSMLYPAIDYARIFRAVLVSFSLPFAIALYSDDVSHTDISKDTVSQDIRVSADTYISQQIPVSNNVALLDILGDTSEDTIVSSVSQTRSISRVSPAVGDTSTRQRIFKVLSDNPDISDEEIANTHGAKIQTVRTYRQQWKRQQASVV